MKKIIFFLILIIVGLDIYLLKEAFAVGHKVNGSCYGYYWEVIETGDFSNNSKVVFFEEHAGGYYVPQTSTHIVDKDKRISLRTYRYQNGTWMPVTSAIAAYGNNAYRDWISNTVGQYGSTDGAYPMDYAPNGCSEDLCTDEKAAKIIECNGEENIINWSDDTCSGDCAPCTGEGEMTEAEVIDECADAGGVLFYNESECYGTCKGICGDNALQEARDACGKLEMDYKTFSNVTCDAECKGCTPNHAQAARNDCEDSGGTLVITSYTCEATPDGGIETDYECEGTSTTINPPPADPEDTKKPETPDPKKDPETPADNPEDMNPDTNPNLDTDLRRKLKENSDKQIRNSNATNDLLDKISRNIAISVDNQNTLNENLAKTQGPETNKLLGKMLGKLVGIDGELEDIQNGWKAPNEGVKEIEAQTLIEGEMSALSDNVLAMKTEIAEVVGIDLALAGGLPSWTLPTPFGDYVFDLNEYAFVFETMGSVVLIAAYYLAAIIIFG